MNRTIKFRGKRLDNGEWVYGSLAETHGKLFIGISTDLDNPVYMMDWHIVDPDTIGQFTGLLDKNGKEIYEGDVLESFSVYLSYQQVGNYPPPNIEVEEYAIKRRIDEVEFSYGSFNIDGFPMMFEDMMNDGEEVDRTKERQEFEAMWEDNSYDIRDKYPNLRWEDFYKPHIIGNIHDNPELLNEK